MTAPWSVPLMPDGAAGRALLRDELAKADYAAAQPTLFDRLAAGFVDWFERLFESSRSGVPPALLVAASIAIAAAVVVAIVLFGRPRLAARSRLTTLFGADDRRTAAELRSAARAAFDRGDFRLAVLDRFRALARGLDERTLVQVFPGTTAFAFARAAAAPFPAERGALATASELFDAVRYADRSATRDDAQAVAALDDRVAAARPVQDVAVPA